MTLNRLRPADRHWPVLWAAGFITLLVTLDQPVVRNVDRRVARLVTSRRHSWLDQIARLSEYLGSVEAVGLAALVETAVRRQRGQRFDAVTPFLFVATIPLEYTLKIRWIHPGPAGRSVAPGRMLAISTANSFPSGHSARLAFVATRWAAARMSRRSAVLGGLVTAGGAWSRVYLGEHWPSDVAGGLLLGTMTGLIAARVTEGSRQ